MISDIAKREDQLGGKTLLIVGLGRIGARLAGSPRPSTCASSPPGAIRHRSRRPSRRQRPPARLLPEADVVALTCPLTPQTENLIDAAALAAMKPTAHLINVARGRVVDEAALIQPCSNSASPPPAST